MKRLAADGTWVADEGVHAAIAGGVLRVTSVGPVRYEEPLLLKLE